MNEANPSRDQLEAWAARGPGRMLVLNPIIDRLLDAPADPPYLGSHLRPIAWTLRKAADEGLPLGLDGELPIDFAQTMCRQFEWRVELPGGDEPRPAMTADALALFLLRAGLLEREKNTLRTTDRGRELVDEPSQLWRACAHELCEGEGLFPMGAELLLAALLHQRPLAPAIAHVVRQALSRTEAGMGRLSEEDARRGWSDTFFVVDRTFEGLSLVHYDARGPWRTIFGEAVAIEALRWAAMKPAAAIVSAN